MQIIQILLQIVILILTHNYIIYLSIQVFVTVIENLISAKKADDMYPYIKIKNTNELSDHDKKNIFVNVKALFLYKLGYILLNGTDNILISIFFGISVVGVASNYSLIISSVTMIIVQVLNAFTASVGNLNAIGSDQQKEEIFDQIFLVCIWIYSFASIGLMLLSNKFIYLWIGEDYMLSELVVFSLVLYFYVNGTQFTAYLYRSTLGLFTKSRIVPMVCALLNIIISIVLAKLIGVAGIFLGSSISSILTTTWVDPYLVYKYSFNKSI